MGRISGILLLALPACAYWHSLENRPATGVPAQPTSISLSLLYPGSDAREASADRVGNVWIATGAGVRVVRLDGTVFSFRAADGLIDEDVRSATGGRDGTALVGFGPQGTPGASGNPSQTEFMEFDGTKITGTPHSFGFSGEIVVANHAAYDPQRDQYWIGTNEGISLFTAAGDLIEHRHPVHPHGMTLGVAITPEGDVWDADQFQLSRLNAGPNADFTATFDPVTQPFQAGDQLLSSVALDGSGRVYVGSLAYGLARVDLSDSSSTVWSEATGLPSLSVQSVAFDGTVWVATADAGLARLDPATGAWRSYRASLGLPSDEVREVTIDWGRTPRRVLITTAAGVASYVGD